VTIITTKSDIDVLDLFVHDRYDAGNLDERELAAALTAHIQTALTKHLNSCPMDEWERLTNLKVQAPDETNLDRFVLGNIAERCSSWDAVEATWARAGLPETISNSLASLQQSGATWRLVDGKLKRIR